MTTFNSFSSSGTQPSNMPADFIQAHLNAEVHPAFGDPSAHFVMDLGRFGGEDDEKALADLKLWEGADVEKEKLYQAIEAYEQHVKTKHKICRSLSDIRNGQHTWADILGEADKATKRHEDKNIVIKSMRKLCDYAASFKDWIDLLPQGDYSGAVSLGFKMALTAATRMSDVHSILFEVLGSIPEYISNAERYKSIYKSTRNIKLVKKTVLLYTSIVVALTEAFSYLRERSLVTPLKAYLLGQRYQKKLEEKLKAVSGATEAVKAEATLCLHEVNAEGLVRTIANEDQRRQDYAEAVVETRQSDQKIFQKLESVDERLSYLTNALDAAYRQLRSSRLLDPVSNSPRQLNVQQSDISRSPSPMAVARRVAMSVKRILRSLGFHKEGPYNDLLDRLQLASSMPSGQQARAVDLINSEGLKNWLKVTASDALLIHGGSADDDTEEPLSFISSKIITTVQHLEPVITIHYFCGLHRDMRTDSGSGGDAQAMMNSLLGQLVTQAKYEFDLADITQHDLGLLQIDDMKTLCMTFGSLVKQLPPASALFCVLDGVSAFEDSKRDSDMVKALRYLVRLVRKSTDVSIKLLITCAGESQNRQRYEISEGQALLIEEELVDDEGHGYNDDLYEEDLATTVLSHSEEYDGARTPSLHVHEFEKDF